MTITRGQLAKMTGVTAEAIRFYERKGLLKPERNPSTNYRYYDETAIKRLRFILKAKNHGFTLSEIKDLLELSNAIDSSCLDVKSKAEEKLKLIEQKIAELQKIKKALNKLISSCQTGKLAEQCPIIEAFEN